MFKNSKLHLNEAPAKEKYLKTYWINSIENMYGFEQCAETVTSLIMLSIVWITMYKATATEFSFHIRTRLFLTGYYKLKSYQSINIFCVMCISKLLCREQNHHPFWEVCVKCINVKLERSWGNISKGFDSVFALWLIGDCSNLCCSSKGWQDWK